MHRMKSQRTEVGPPDRPLTRLRFFVSVYFFCDSINCWALRLVHVMRFLICHNLSCLSILSAFPSTPISIKCKQEGKKGGREVGRGTVAVPVFFFFTFIV